MRTTWIEAAVVVAAALALGGCATSKEDLLPHGEHTMRDVWNQETSAGGAPAAQQLLEPRLCLRRPLTDSSAVQPAASDYTRTAANEILRQFHRLPNPDMVMYVFPHLAGSEPVPVPGYATVFPFYRRVQYAMPGERLEDY
jgi:conjugative transfer region lipoprotein (TIGR03751 family)